MSGAARPPAAHALSPASLLRRFGPLLGLLILCGALGAASDRFLTADNLLNVCRQSAVNALVSLGQLTVIITGGIDLSVGSVLGLCCVMVALLMHAGVSPLISVVAALAIGSALGAINGILLTKLHLPHPFIPTLGMMNVARGLALVISGGFPLSELPSGFRFWGAGSIGWIPAPVILVLLFCGAFYVFLSRTTIGRDIYAIGGNQQAARLSGVPVDARLILAYALSGLTAAAGAIVLAGRMNSGFPLAGVGFDCRRGDRRRQLFGRRRYGRGHPGGRADYGGIAERAQPAQRVRRLADGGDRDRDCSGCLGGHRAAARHRERHRRIAGERQA